MVMTLALQIIVIRARGREFDPPFLHFNLVRELLRIGTMLWDKILMPQIFLP